MKKRTAVLLLGLLLAAACGKSGAAEKELPAAEAAGEETEAAAALPPAVSCYLQETEVFDEEGRKIYGVAYIPEADGPVPLVIFAHGLTGNYQNGDDYARALASRGFAAYCFDFRGGGGKMSDGDMTEMSVMTEVSDLETVLAEARTWPFADPEKIVFFGESQGGLVSAVTAARHPDEVAGLVLLYPAFQVTDDLHDLFGSREEIRDTFEYKWFTAGRIYAEDMWDYDVYGEIGRYDRKVLILHGDEDEVVPLAYSERAAAVYPDAELRVIEGGTHGFSGESRELSEEYLLAYMRDL